MTDGAGTDRRVLVVDGAGYVGNVLVRRMIACGYKVTVLDRLLFGQGAALAGVVEEPGFRFLHGDLAAGDLVDAALAETDDVVLLAGLVGDPIASAHPDYARAVNEGCKRLLERADTGGVERFVFTSTCSNYGLRDTDDPATEEAELAPVSLYAELKVEFERFVLDRSWRLCPTLLRIATAYGASPRMRFDLTISEFTRTLAAGETLVVYDADTWRPYCHVADISRAVISVLEADAATVEGQVFNVGHDAENYTKRMVVDVIQEALDGAGLVEYESGGRDPRNYRVSFAKIRDTLGFAPSERVPVAVARLAAAVRAGVFDDYAARPSFYGNRLEAAPGGGAREAG